MIRFHPSAKAELLEASEYYENQQSGLGFVFLEVFRRSLDELLEHPETWGEDTKGRRKYRIVKFPYFIIYRLEEKTIYILAIAHAARKPQYWEKRDKL